MKIIRKIASILLCVTALCASADVAAQTRLGSLSGGGMAAQSSQTTFNWTSNVKMTSATQGEIILKVTIADGWHLYGMNLPKGGPKPTAFDFSASKGIKLVGGVTASSKPISKMDKMFNLNLSYWVGNVTFRQKFKVTNAADAFVDGKVSYMGCNDKTCSPPKTFKFSKKVNAK